MVYRFLLYEIKDRVAVITLNRPEKLNALNPPLWKEICQALKAGDQDSAVDVLIVTGAGRGFCAGDDIRILTQLQDPKDAEDLFLNCIYGLPDTIIHLQKPLITAVNGYAYGGGCELVLMSDLAIASREATFALPEGRIGAWPVIFATFGPLAIGLKASNELTMIGEPITAERALRMGLINQVVPHDQLMDAAFGMAGQLMKSSPVALKIIKETSARILGNHLHDFWIASQRFLKEISKTSDFLEGATAFMEKRPPIFRGK